MVATTNVDGSNPGPNIVTLPDPIQYPIGNVWKIGVFGLKLSPAAVAANTSAEQAFANTGIGLLIGDFVSVSKPTWQAGLAIVNERVSAADTLAIAFGNFTAAAINPTANEVYQVTVLRPLPEWSPGGSVQMDW